MKNIITSILLIFLLTSCGGNTSRENSSISMNETMEKGSEQRDIVLTDMDGNSYNFKDFDNRKVYFKFWGSWCPICLDSMERFDEFAGSDRDYEILSVVAPNIMGEKSKDDFITWFNSLGYKNIKVLFDETGDFIRAFNIQAAPTNIIHPAPGENVVAPGELDPATIDQVFDEFKKS